jgi:hypothetical protein
MSFDESGEGGSATGYAYGPCSGTVFTDVPAGNGTLFASHNEMYADFGSVSVVVASNTAVEKTIPVSVVKGVVRFANGQPVEYPYASLSANDERYFEAPLRDEQGNYAFFGVPPGNFVVWAQDQNFGLSTEVTGVLQDVNVPVLLDITLPPAGVVQGTFTDASGNPIREAEVYARSSALEFDRMTYTDENGFYSFEQVALGDVTVWASHPQTRLVGIGQGQLVTNGQTLRIDVAPVVTAGLSGRVLAVDGTSPVPDARVVATTTTSYGPFGTITFETQTDSSGAFSFAALPVGDLRLTAQSEGILGRTGVTLTSAAASVDILLGDGATLPHVLSGADGSRYDIECTGALINGGFGDSNDAYDRAYALRFDDWIYFPCSEFADVRQAGRELVLGTYELEYIGLEAKRQIYVPSAGGYARYVESLYNPTSSSITVGVRVSGSLGSYPNTQILVSPASTGNRYAVTADTGTDPTLAHVFSGSNPAASGEFQFSSDGFLSYWWQITIPPGQRAAFLHFAVQRADGDTLGAQQQAEALANGTQPGMFDGLSEADRAAIKNFAVTP